MPPHLPTYSYLTVKQCANDRGASLEGGATWKEGELNVKLAESQAGWKRQNVRGAIYMWMHGARGFIILGKDTSPYAEVLLASDGRPKTNEAGNRIILLACPSRYDRSIICGASA